MDNLSLAFHADGHLYYDGIGPVFVHVDRNIVFGGGRLGVVCRGAIIDCILRVPVKEVAVKIPHMRNNFAELVRDEAEKHARAWLELPHVLRPLGFLPAVGPMHAAIFVMNSVVPFESFLIQAGPPQGRSFNQTKAIARIVYQLLEFIVSADQRNMVHRDIKPKSMFVKHAHDLRMASLALGHFGGLQRGVLSASGNICYSLKVDTWDNTSPRLAACVYNTIVDQNANCGNIQLNRRLVFHNELYGWARVAFGAFIPRQPPDALFGPTHEDGTFVPGMGQGDVSDCVCHMSRLALRVLTPSAVNPQVNPEDVTTQPWFNTMRDVLDGNQPGQ